MLNIVCDYNDPEKQNIEIVERKSFGHPDTLADKLAEECSRVYSSYCIDKFSCVLHHNFDKLYIGAGLFKYENNKLKKYKNIRVDLNGRASNTMNGEKIDLKLLLEPVIKKYLKSVLPRLDVENDVDININCTQNTKRAFWYSPRDINDVPDAFSVTAGDTALCVSHGGNTFCEKIILEIEKFFWKYDDCYPAPRFSNIGQDIKIMISRIGKHITVTMCVPVFKDCFSNDAEFSTIIKGYEKAVFNIISKIENKKGYSYSVEINRKSDGTYDPYSLIIGSCCECGEEGIVGRGNGSQGLICGCRAHTVEAPCGKNPRYHTGKVVSFMCNNVTKRIYNELNAKSTLFALTRNRNSLTNPFLFYLSVEDNAKIEQIKSIVNDEFNLNNWEKILQKVNVF